MNPFRFSETTSDLVSWAELLEQGGMARGEAAWFAPTLAASGEGAVVLSRAEQGFEPFDLVAEELLDQIHSAASSRRRSRGSHARSTRASFEGTQGSDIEERNRHGS